MIPLALYIHLPWCVKKCPYCDFNSHALKKPLDRLSEAHYLDALLRDLDASLPHVWGRTVQSIFLGGGTPSLFSPSFFDRLLSAIRSRIRLKPHLETTMEANPGVVEHGLFSEYKAAGISRISLGVQSFQPEKLKALGRIHTDRDAILASEAILNAGFTSWNIDLMHGLPHQSPRDALSDIAQAIQLQPTHLSWYQLTLEPNTAFYSKPPTLPLEETLAEIEDQGLALLAVSGFTRYEISAYAKLGHTAWHNQNYWRFGDYLGIGAGAHGKITDFNTQTITRTVKEKYPNRYADPTLTQLTETKILTPDEIPFEYMLNICRLFEGFTSEDFESHTLQDFGRIQSNLHQAIDQKLLEHHLETDRYRPTPLGLRFYNNLVALF